MILAVNTDFPHGQISKEERSTMTMLACVFQTSKELSTPLRFSAAILLDIASFPFPMDRVVFVTGFRYHGQLRSDFVFDLQRVQPCRAEDSPRVCRLRVTCSYHA